MVQGNYIRLTQWAARHGMHRMTSLVSRYAPARTQPKKIGSIVYVLDNPDAPAGRIVGYARVSSGEQKPHLEPQANRLWAYAGKNGIAMDSVVSEIASGLNDKRPKLLKLLADPGVSTIIVERRDRLGPLRCGDGQRNASSPRRFSCRH